MREILNQNIIVHVFGFVSCKYGYEILSSHVAMSYDFYFVVVTIVTFPWEKVEICLDCYFPCF